MNCYTLGNFPSCHPFIIICCKINLALIMIAHIIFAENTLFHHVFLPKLTISKIKGFIRSTVVYSAVKEPCFSVGSLQFPFDIIYLQYIPFLASVMMIRLQAFLRLLSSLLTHTHTFPPQFFVSFKFPIDSNYMTYAMIYACFTWKDFVTLYNYFTSLGSHIESYL